MHINFPNQPWHLPSEIGPADIKVRSLTNCSGPFEPPKPHQSGPEACLGGAEHVQHHHSNSPGGINY